MVLIQTIDTSVFSPPSPDPAGIAFLDFSNTLLVSDSEVNETPFFGTENLFEIGLGGNLVSTSSTLSFSSEPTGVDLNPANQNLFISNDDAEEIVEFDLGSDSVINTIDTTTFGSFDPEGVAFASNLGTLFVADGANSEVYQISTDGTLISSFDTASLGVLDPEGIEYDPSSGNLYLVGEPSSIVLEVTTSGSFVSALDISAANPIVPAGLALGPSSQNASETSLYISDRGIDNNADPTASNDGRVFEFSLTPPPPPAPPTDFSTIFVSSNTSGTVGGVNFSDEDILAFDIASETWSLLFDGSDVGLGVSSADLNAFHVNSDGSILLSLNQTFTLPDVGSVDENDIVRFTPTSTGTTTAGSYEFYFDGSDVGLSGGPEDIDAIAFTPDDSLLISTSGSPSVPGASGSDEDLLVFNATSLGETTSGTFSLFADNSDVGLGNNGGEDVNASFVDNNGDVYLSTNGDFQVIGLSGQNSDISIFTPSSLGSDTSGTFSSFLDGSEIGFGGENIDGLTLV